MGVVSSMCKCKKRSNFDAIVHDNYTQTANTSPSISSDKTQCSAMSREPTNNSSLRYNYYSPAQQQMYSTSTKQIRGHSDFPLFSTPFYLPFNGKSNISYHHSNPYVAQAYNHMTAAVSPSIHNTHHSRTTLDTSTANPCRIPSVSDVVQTTGDEHPTESYQTITGVESSVSDVVQTTGDEYLPESYRTITRVESSVTTDTNELSRKQNVNDGSRLVKRCASAPIDMFLIDISNENVLLGQPVSMNIRHLLLDTLENHHTNSSTPMRIEPASITTYAHENLLNYIPYVCERYPNITVESDQLTRSTLHVRAPSEFSRSLNAFT